MDILIAVVHSIMSSSFVLPVLHHTSSLSLFPTVCSNTCPLNWRYHLIISSSATSFSSCPQSFPASWCFLLLALGIRLEKSSSLSFSIRASAVYLALVSLRIDLFDLYTVQGTPKCCPQHHSLKVLILQLSAFLTSQFSHLYMTIG